MMPWLNVDNPKESTEKTLELIHEYIKVTGHNINIQRPIVFIQTDNEHINTKVKTEAPFIIIQNIKRNTQM